MADEGSDTKRFKMVFSLQEVDGEHAILVPPQQLVLEFSTKEAERIRVRVRETEWKDADVVLTDEQIETLSFPLIRAYYGEIIQAGTLTMLRYVHHRILEHFGLVPPLENVHPHT